MKYFLNFKNNFRAKSFISGFLIVETIVAAAIIVFAIVGPLSAAKSGLSAVSDSRDQLQTVFLAEEAFEFVRLIRDRNIFAGRDWLYGLDTCKTSDGCGVDPFSYAILTNGYDALVSTTNVVISCSSSNNFCELKNSNQSAGPSLLGFFSHNSVFTLNTGIKRKVKIETSSDNNEAKISITIERNKAGFRTRSYSMSGYLYKWKFQPGSII